MQKGTSKNHGPQSLNRMKFGKLKQNGFLSHEVTPENGEFLHLVPENCNLAVYSNFCFLNNFLLKSQNKVPLVLGGPLRSVVYDSAFNSIFPFLVNFGILSPNHVTSANQGFRIFFSTFICFVAVIGKLDYNQ